MTAQKWAERAKKWEAGKLRIKVTCKGELLFDQEGDPDDVIFQFKAFLKDHPELLRLTCSGKIHFHPRPSREA